MNDIILKSRIKNAAKTDEQWLNINPILKLGEKVWVITCLEPFTIAYKVGDGINSYKDLSLILNQGIGSKNYAPYSSNLGFESITGVMGYRIKDMQPNVEIEDDSTNVIVPEGGTYTIDLEEGQEIDQRLIGKKYTIYIKATSERVGTITGINGNIITVDTFYHPNNWPDHIEDIIEENGDIIRGQKYYYDNSYFFSDEVLDAGYINFGECANAEGYKTKALSFATHAEGQETIALGKCAHTEGIDTYAGYAGHAQNKGTKAIGLHSHAQNYYNTAGGDNSDAGGYGTKARGKNSVTRGEYTEADGKNAVANGWKTKAKGDNSDAGGFETETEGLYSFGRGYQNKAKHKGSALFGRNHTSSRDMQFLAGQFADTSDTNIMAAVGVGTANNARKNGLAVYADGRVRAGKGGTSGNDLVTVEQLTQQWTTKDINNLTYGDVIKGVVTPVSYGLKFYGYSDLRFAKWNIYFTTEEIWYQEPVIPINESFTVYPGKYYISLHGYYYDVADQDYEIYGCIKISGFDDLFSHGDFFEVTTKQTLTIEYLAGSVYHSDTNKTIYASIYVDTDIYDNNTGGGYVYDYEYGAVSANDLNNHKANIKISKQAQNYCVLMNERLYTDNKLITPTSSNNLDDFPSRANDNNFGTIIGSEDIVINNGIPKINTNSTNFQNGLKPLDQKIENVKNSIMPQKKAIISTQNSEGWYRIAKASAITTTSGIFKVTASIQVGGLWSEIIFIASKAFGADGAVKVLNHQKHTNGAAIDNIRIGYSDSTASTPAYIDIHCKNNSNSNTDTVTISVELLDKTNTDALTGGIWQLLNIVQEDTANPWVYAKTYYMRDMLCENADGSAYITTPENPSDNHITNVDFVNKESKSLISEFMAEPYVWADLHDIKSSYKQSNIKLIRHETLEPDIPAFILRPTNIIRNGIQCELISPLPDSLERYVEETYERHVITNIRRDSAYIEFGTPTMLYMNVDCTIYDDQNRLQGMIENTQYPFYDSSFEGNEGTMSWWLGGTMKCLIGLPLHENMQVKTYPLPLSVTDPIVSNEYSAVNVRTMNKVTQPLDQRLSFLEGGLLEYNEGYNLEYTFMDHPEGAETGWCFYSPIEEGNPYTKVRLGGIYIIPYYPTVANVTVSYIDGVSADGTERERLFTLDEATRRQIFDFVMQHEEEIYSNDYWLYVGFRNSYVEVKIEEWNQSTVVYSIQIPYSVPTNLIFDCKDYKYLDFNNIDHVVEPMISVAKLGFKKEN